MVAPTRPTSTVERSESVEVKFGRPMICSRKSSAGALEGLFTMSVGLSVDSGELGLSRENELGTQKLHEAESEICEFLFSFIWVWFFVSSILHLLQGS